jgi:hypothetical protein
VVDALFGLAVLFAVVAILVFVGLAAGAAGVDSRPGYSDDQSHHN